MQLNAPNMFYGSKGHKAPHFFQLYGVLFSYFKYLKISVTIIFIHHMTCTCLQTLTIWGTIYPAQVSFLWKGSHKYLHQKLDA